MAGWKKNAAGNGSARCQTDHEVVHTPKADKYFADAENETSFEDGDDNNNHYALVVVVAAVDAGVVVAEVENQRMKNSFGY